jgi:hypothetical protein
MLDWEPDRLSPLMPVAHFLRLRADAPVALDPRPGTFWVALDNFLYINVYLYSKISPGWHSSALQIASSVDSRIAFALPFFKMEILAIVMPTLSESSVTLIFRFANMTSMLMMIAMLVSLHR